jgi:uncharacterized protein YqhQ
MAASVGGQAVLEGVMMRGPSSWAVAVRRPDGRISEIEHDVASVAVRRRWLRLPIIRGIVALGESLTIGFKALAISANFATTDEGEEDASEGIGKGYIVGSFVVAILFTVVVFKVSPALLTEWIGVKNSFGFVLIEGGLRVLLLVVYLALISLLPDLRRVFEYHAAEHKAINAFEDGAELEPETVQKYSLIHVRCGTAFLLWVMVVAIVVFGVLGRPSLYWLIASRVLLLPLIAGIAYEVIRFAGKHSHNPLVRAVLAPGLWLQRLTTRPPSLDQIAVAIVALQKVLVLEEKHRSAASERVEVMA